MALLDLVKNENAFPIGRHGHSKNITYLPNQSRFHLVRVEGWDYPTGDPILDGGKTESTKTNDFIFRGGLKTHTNRVRQDVKRITQYLASTQGFQFILRQGALQLLNPQVNTRTFNAGVSLLAQVAASGISRFKRHGAIPEPADVDINAKLGPGVNKFVKDSSFAQKIESSALGSKLGITAEGLGNFAENAMGGNYISLIGKDNVRENAFSLGDPGAPTSVSTIDKILGDINPFRKKDGRNNYGDYLVTEVLSKIDKINYQTVYLAKDNKPTPNLTDTDNEWSSLKDYCNFRFEVLQSDTFTSTQNIVFRAFLDGFTDNYTATHNEYKYNGRGESFYTYQKFNRAISINFKVAAQSRHEMKPLYQKLNYLVAQTAPNYSKGGRIRTPYMRLTMGDYFKRIPGVLKSANVTWQVNYPWEIKLDPVNQDKDMKILPHVLDVSISFQPIHDFTPDNSLAAEYIGIGEDSQGLNSWLLASKGPISSEVEDQNDDAEKNDNKKIDEDDKKNNKSSNKTYTVKSGDSLSGIAAKLGIPNWRDIQSANNLSGTTIHPGQILNIP